MKKIIEKVMIYLEDHQFHKGSMEIENGLFKKFIEEDFELDESTLYMIPGLVDIHFHGCMGADLCDADMEAMEKMAEYEASQGITSICPASMTMSVPQLHQIMRSVGNYNSEKGAHFLGIHMEGPFISKKRKGAQAEENIIPCDVELFKELQIEAQGRIRIADLAPEVEGAMEFIDVLKDQVNISLAHTDADYETALEALERGARHVTHLCNAMPALHHRNPGVIAAAADSDAYVEMICDGIHIHPAMVRSLFKIFGRERICLISDSMRATGLEDGWYTLGGQDVHVEGNLAILKDGTIAGSVTNLMNCMKIAVKEMRIPMEDAILCATENPAREAGFFDQCGSIAPEKRADFLLLDQDMNLKSVWMDGEKCY